MKSYIIYYRKQVMEIAVIKKRILQYKLPASTLPSCMLFLVPSTFQTSKIFSYHPLPTMRKGNTTFNRSLRKNQQLISIYFLHNVYQNVVKSEVLTTIYAFMNSSVRK